MSTTPDVSPSRVAEVGAELYDLLPAHVRQVDLATGSALRSLLGVLARSSTELDVELEAYYDALFVETADAASLPGLAALVAAIPLQPMPPGAALDQRAYVANTVRYRRGKGTARVLEALARDVSGDGAAAVEYFLRVARLQHLLDVRPERPATGSLVDGDTHARAGAFQDRLPRLLDVRDVVATHAHPSGRFGILSVGVHLLRPVVPVFPAPPVGTALAASDVSGVPQAQTWPVAGGTTGHFQLAAQPGAPLRLFAPDRVADAAGARPEGRDLADRLRRLPLHRETDELRRAAVEGRAPRLTGRPWFDASGLPFRVFVRRAGETTFAAVPPAQLRIANLETKPSARPPATLPVIWYQQGATQATRTTDSAPITCAVDPVTGRVVTALPAPGTPDVTEVRVAYATGHGRPVGAGAQERGAADQPFEIRDDGPVTDLIWVVDPSRPTGGSAQTSSRTVSSLAAALAEVAAAGANRRSFVILARCDVESVSAAAGTLDIEVPAESEVHLVAAEWRIPVAAPGVPGDPALRGFVVRRERRFTVEGTVRVQRGSGPDTAEAGRLVVDGLEITGGMRLAVRSVSHLELRHTTLRSPGAAALTATGQLTDVTVEITRTMCGPIRLGSSAIPVTGDLTLCDSVVASDGIATGDTLAAPGLDCCLRNVTVLGSSQLRELTATNVLFAAPLTVSRRQSGCVRFSFVPDGSAAPRLYRCQPQLALAAARQAKGAPLSVSEAQRVRLSVEPVLLDRSLDEPTVAMLHELCPDAIRLGGEDEAEMGAFAVAAHGIARANLVSLFDDFVPSALRAGVIDDTRSATVAQRRNTP
ncbi:hypothetical protein [Arthrobacter pascens]|uniref:hypothetical protein n=1 Tax=Arthrobacter pascens TaxID=1677 RepID=UPI00196B9FB2|nr:hypothetical protein [Arthrobacter pascens]MBN3496377.1 hypothetical protein [Arthrobacter pascens]